MLSYNQIEQKLINNPRAWLVTGAAGFIGSNIVEKLLLLNQVVIGIDNFNTGRKRNLFDIEKNVESRYWKNFYFYNLNILDKNILEELFCKHHIDFVLHHAAISSVPYSIKYPEEVRTNNILGFNNILDLSSKYDIKSLVYASSSSVYGDDKSSTKIETQIGTPLSPYASSKLQNEQDALSNNNRNLKTTGLRYFNIYGRRQDPNGAYAAVIPKWLDNIINNKSIYINGDGTTTRDFCCVDDVVRANILACFNNRENIENNFIYNIASGKSVSLNQLVNLIVDCLKKYDYHYQVKPEYRDFIDGDIRHSCANIKLVRDNLNFTPEVDLEFGIFDLIKWHFNQHAESLST